MARILDGRVTAVLGTHTHVQTNDARVLPGGTAAITDAGMTGPHDSVIGVQADLAIRRMRTGMPVRFQPADGDVRIEGALVECDARAAARSDRVSGPLRDVCLVALRNRRGLTARRARASEDGHQAEVADEDEPATRSASKCSASRQ